MTKSTRLNLYTVTIVFEDRTYAIEQVSDSDSNAALSFALRNAEATEKYPRTSIDKLIDNYLGGYQVADRKGVWIWHVVPNEIAECSDIFGGLVIQTDPTGPTR